jgi:NADPH:quinone reductase-like Zn-dependent oxidoreductase
VFHAALQLNPKEITDRYGSNTAVFFLVEVNTARLDKIRELFDAGKLRADVGAVLPLDPARTAHEMLAGAPHARGKIVLKRVRLDHAFRRPRLLP